MFNVVSLEYGFKIDCSVPNDTEFARLSFEQRRLAKLRGIDFWTITKEDLILSKLNWARDSLSEIQIRDIANLTENEYDSEYVSNWIKKLNLRTIWEALQQWKTLHRK